MRKVLSLIIALAWSVSVFAAGNGQVGSVGSPTPQSARAIEARIQELSEEMKTNPSTERVMAITEEMTKLAEQYIAMLPKTENKYTPSPSKIITLKADKFLVTPDEVFIGGTFTKIRLTATDADVYFDGDLILLGVERHQNLSFSMYHLAKGQTKELSLAHDEYSNFSHRWELRDDMYVNKLRVQISSGNLTGSRGKLTIELIP